MSTANQLPFSLTLIAAMARHGVIGVDNRLPWRLPEDLRHFREVTQGHPVIMGRRTWESLPEKFRPLPDRQNVVLSRQPGFEAPGALCFMALPDALAALRAIRPQETEVFVIGGAELYRLALPLADRLLLTEIDLEVAGDAYFPSFSRDDWQQTRYQPGVSASGPAFALVTYMRAPRRAS
jgi:dihydrofolate reductase